MSHVQKTTIAGSPPAKAYVYKPGRNGRSTLSFVIKNEKVTETYLARDFWEGHPL